MSFCMACYFGFKQYFCISFRFVPIDGLQEANIQNKIKDTETRSKQKYNEKKRNKPKLNDTNGGGLTKETI